MSGRFRGVRALLALAMITAGCGGSPTSPPSASEGPVVHSVSPSTGTTDGATEVTIRGLRFAAGATVTIGGQAATEVNVQSSEALTAKTPAGAAGAAAVVVTVAGRSGSLAGGFNYQVPPNNALPTVESITGQGSRAGQPANFADLGETLRVTATVTDSETAPDQLEYRWSASAGTISGTGASVSWQAPATAQTPLQATITLRVVERYGPGGVFQQEATGTLTVSVHDSAREIGGMAVRFLEEFSKPQTNTDWRNVMRDFSETACPDPRHVDAERDDVERHIQNFFMHSYTIGSASVSVNFGAGCVFIRDRFRPGDACVSVPTNWNSTNKQDGNRAITIGIDYLSAVYSRAGSRWWLCSSDFEVTGVLGHPSYSMR
jgi:IPT/TIG domain